MKTLGILGGMSYESTLEYYRLLCEGVKHRLGGHHSPKIVLHSFDFAEIKALQYAGDWESAGKMLADAAKHLENAGADLIIIATNTMHMVAGAIESNITIPLLHIADGTAERVRASGYKKVGLLGTRFTMDHDFYAGRLREKYGLHVLTPEESEKDHVHRIIYDELCLGKVDPESRKTYQNIIQNLQSRGAECVILGCTEICLLIDQSTSVLPVFDTTAIHVEYALEKMLEGE